MSWDDLLFWIGLGAKRADLNLIKRHIDLAYYASQTPDAKANVRSLDQAARHYLFQGWIEGKDPNRDFSTSEYLKDNEDVRLAGMNPFVHFLKYGRNEGRSSRSNSAIKSFGDEQTGKVLNNSDLKPTRLASLSAPPEFDVEFYRMHNLDLAQIPDLWMHYLTTGWKEGRDPSPDFSTKLYLEMNDDVRRSHVNPFLHYLTYGRREGRKLTARISQCRYPRKIPKSRGRVMMMCALLE